MTSHCSHVTTSVGKLTSEGLAQLLRNAACDVCRRTSSTVNVWLCLFPDCYMMGCTGFRNDHSTDHNNTNTDHCLQLNVTNKRVWCYKCSEEVDMSGNEPKLPGALGMEREDKTENKKDNPHDNSSASYLVSAISRHLHDSDIADFSVNCGERAWKLHSNILAIRSPFFKAAIANNMAEKLDIKIEIKELDPQAMQEVINFMYGNPIGEAPFGSLLEASERFQMADMKKEVIKIGIKKMTKENVLEIGKLAEMYDIEQLLQLSAEFIVNNDVEMKEDDLVPKLTSRVLNNLKEALKLANLKVKNSKPQCSCSQILYEKDLNS